VVIVVRVLESLPTYLLPNPIKESGESSRDLVSTVNKHVAAALEASKKRKHSCM